MSARSDEDAALARRAQAGDRAAALALVRSCEGLAGAACKRFAGLGIPLEDLMQEARAGLLVAVGKFDPGRGLQFSTYATWWMFAAVRAAAYPGGGSANRAFGKLPAAKRALFRRGEQVSAQTLAAETGDTEATMEAVLAWFARPASEWVYDEDSDELISLFERLPDARESAEDRLLGEAREDERRRAVSRAVDALPQAQRAVVRARFWAGQTLDQAAASTPRTQRGRRSRSAHVTRERARQIEAEALEALRSKLADLEY